MQNVNITPVATSFGDSLSWFRPSGDVATQRAAAQGSALELAARDWTSQSGYRIGVIECCTLLLGSIYGIFIHIFTDIH